MKKACPLPVSHSEGGSDLVPNEGGMACVFVSKKVVASELGCCSEGGVAYGCLFIN